MIKIDFEKMGGLIPAIIQDHESGEVLMVAFMDEKTLKNKIESFIVNYDQKIDKNYILFLF